eukprot:TRINITY_DN12433_c0_g1_i1.p1 TRINITY_DN12433_c0_g1~~TRINITY_DN12433_c0_g1_i1.p1  ORF type:complete len:1676 (-),score=402.97 TRINITY_DN12433_c0_g1_i1:60-5087(-)
MTGLPIRFQELLQLSSLGINPQSFSFNSLTLESDKFACVREISAENHSCVTIVDLEKPQTPTKFPVTAESAIMNPLEKVLALRAGNHLQVFNIDQKKKLKEHVMTDQVVFWKWINNTTIAIVTKTAVFHWSLDNTNSPSKIFDRHPALADTQIMNYRTNSSLTWLVLIGIAQRDEMIVGNLQLYSTERQLSQNLEGHAAAFTNYQVTGATGLSTIFSFATRNANGGKLFIIEVGESKGFQKRSVDFYFPPDAEGDFPVSMQISQKYGIIYVITKLGYIHLFDLETGTTIYMVRFSPHVVFVTTFNTSTNGVLAVNRSGQLLSVSVDEANIIPYICKTLQNVALGLSLASRAGLSGAEPLFQEIFTKSLQAGNFREAGKIAATSPRGFLRTAQTILRLQSAPQTQGQLTPLLQYFGGLLDAGPLNKIETLEIVRPVLQQGKIPILEKWLADNKLECCEELGDAIRTQDVKLALHVYYKAEVHAKVVAILVEMGQSDKVVDYCIKTSYNPDWSTLLRNIISVQPQTAVSFTTALLNAPQGPLLDISTVVDIFLEKNLIKDITGILLDVLRPDRPEDGALQTRLLEVNLQHAPAVADAILGNEMFHHYDQKKIAVLSERVGLPHRALEHYQDINDIKRVVINNQGLKPEFLVNYFMQLKPEDVLECLRDLLKHNVRPQNHNLNLVVRVASKHPELTPQQIISLFESFNSFEGMFAYLTNIVNYSQEPDVHYKYIEAAAKVGNFSEVERICRDSKYYDPEKTKNFLKEARLSDQTPLIIVCDRFDFITDLIKYLYNTNQFKAIETYTQKINPANAPEVVGILLDLDYNEDSIKSLITGVRNQCSVEDLVAQVENRNRLKIIRPWLESRANEGNVDAATHNALAKISIDTGINSEQFLKTNQYYDSRVVGKYCEDRDPQLALLVYKRGQCDKELVEMSNKHSLFKPQARYVLQRQDQDLWRLVLSNENEYRNKFLEFLINSAIPECTKSNTEEVSIAVQAIMNADLPTYLISLLEKLLLEPSDFRETKSLKNLLLLTAIKAEPSKLMGYIQKLDGYDSLDIAEIAIKSNLFEEAFEMHRKYKHHVQAIQVLVDNIKDIDRAHEFAKQVNLPEVYSILAKAQLDEKLIKESINSYLKANDPENFLEVIKACKEGSLFEDLIRYLQMCRKKLKEKVIDSELLYTFAKTDRNSDLEEFITQSNYAEVQEIGDRCYNEGLYESARLLFDNVSNFPRLASTLVKLHQYSAAVDAARKANNTRTWKEVNKACVDAKEFRLAQLCGINIIINSDELQDLIFYYESRGHTSELIALMEAGLGNDRAHAGIFTELAVLYCKYSPEKLLNHLKNFHSRLHVSKVLRACEKYQQWAELTYLYVQSNDPENAAVTMMTYPEQAWNHASFLETLQNVPIAEIVMRAIRFYLSEHPLLLNELLIHLKKKLDHTRTVQLLISEDKLALARDYLVDVQNLNNYAVNESLNGLYLEEEDYDSLRRSVETYDAIDSIRLANTLKNHELIEFRRIAALLFKKNKKWEESVELSKKDSLWADAIAAAASSKETTIAEGLLRYFAERKQPNDFVNVLYTCYDLLRPDVVVEISWRHQYSDFAMPYLAQFLREYVTKVDRLVSESDQKLAASKSAEENSLGQPPTPGSGSASGFVGGFDESGFQNNTTGWVSSSLPSVYFPQ